MRFQKKTFRIGLFSILVFMVTSQPPAGAASVYAIPKHTGKTVNVYDVLEGAQEGQLEYRAMYSLKYAGGADVIIDTRSSILFVTFENRNQIELINARTFLSEGETVAQGALDLAGLELDYIDQDTTLLYTVDRGTNKLFMYDWDADEKELTLLPYSDSQDWYTLLPYNPEDDPVTACGLALDESNGTLYISQFKRHPSVVYSNIVSC